MKELLTDNNKIIQFLKDYPVDKRLSSNLKCDESKHCQKYTKFDDYIYKK